VPAHLIEESPVRIEQIAPGIIQVDFGRVAFGHIVFNTTAFKTSATVQVRFGEWLNREGRIDQQAPGSFRHGATRVSCQSRAPIAPEPDQRNTTPPALSVPEHLGHLVPFRWIEIEGWTGEIRTSHLHRRTPILRTWNNDASSFACSDARLVALWDLCRHTLRSTTFAGVYFDGDRERVSYEIDAYLSQLIHEAVDPGSSIARATFVHLLKNRTWPTESAFHLLGMAYADWWQTGDRAWLTKHFDELPPLLLLERAGRDGLLHSNHEHQTRDDHIDWPPGERDGFRLTPVNTVINALHLQALARLADLARALGRDTYATELLARREHALNAFDALLFDRTAGLYRDGIDTSHHSLHSNLFPLTCEVVPPERVPAVLAYLRSRGMACSTYAAHHLLEGLFNHDAGDQAHALLTALDDRGWLHMLDLKATLTWEAWDPVYKPNLDGSHLRSAHPAYHLSRHVLGIQPALPGWLGIRLRPQPGPLTYAEGRVPTPRGPVDVRWQSAEGVRFFCEIKPPENIPLHLSLPGVHAKSALFLDGKPAPNAQLFGGRWSLPRPLTGAHILEVR
jgi:hypothetical protein